MKQRRLIIGVALLAAAMAPVFSGGIPASAAAAPLQNCAGSSTTNGSGGGPCAQDLVGSGSDTTQYMMSAIDSIYEFSPGCQNNKYTSGGTSFEPEDFSCQSPDPAGTITTENYEHDMVHEAYFIGSGGGLNQLCSTGGTPPYANVAWARSSRVPSSSDCTGLDFVAYAKDAISWEAFDVAGNTAYGSDGQNNSAANWVDPNGVSHANTCSGFSGFCLSQLQLQDIYNCTVNNWSQVGGQNVAIKPYLPPTSSGTEQTFAGFLGYQPSSTSTCTIYSTPENTNATIVANGDVDNAIAPFSYGIYKTQVHGRDNAFQGAIDAVTASASSINSGAFPYTRSLFNVVCGPYIASGGTQCAGGQSNSAAENYVGPDGWICKPASSHTTDPITLLNFHNDIANAIAASGFVAITSGTIGGGDTNTGFCRLTLH